MDKQTILIVDDSGINRKILNNALSSDYNIIEATNGLETLKIINKTPDIALILLDIMMPELNGIEVLKILKSRAETSNIPIMLITAADSNEEYAFELGAVDFIAKPFNINVVKSRVKTQIKLRNLEHSISNNAVDYPIFDKLTEYMLSALFLNGQGNLTNILEKNRTAVSIFIDKLKKKELSEIDYNFMSDETFIRSIAYRDMGKLFIDKTLLCKPSGLNKEEFEIIKTHTTLSDKIIDKISKSTPTSILSLLMEVCYYHHENYDGSGYPKGLAGKAIPFSARVAALFDCYEAIISPKPYRKALSHSYAMDFIGKNIGIKFDPDITPVFLSMDKELEMIYLM